MIGNPREQDRPEDLLGKVPGRRRRSSRDPLAERLDHWLDWLEPPRPPEPWCGSVPPER